MFDVQYPRLCDEGEEVVSDLKVENRQALIRYQEFFLTGSVTAGSIDMLQMNLLRRAHEMRHKSVKRPFRLYITSGGGSVTAGLALGAAINQVRDEFGITVHTVVRGEAASMGFVIAQFGDKRLADRFAVCHLHDLSWGVFGNTGMHRDTFAHIEDLRWAVATIFAERNTAGQENPNWWLENYLDRADHYLTAAEAQRLGLVDELVGGIVRGSAVNRPTG